jgi:type IV pilus modification protein PilV
MKITLNVRGIYKGTPAPSLRAEGGFTLIETLIALAVFSIGMLAMATLATTAIKATDTAKARTQALNIATQRIESIRAIGYDKIQTTDTSADTAGKTGNVSRTCAQSGVVFTCVPTVNTDTIDNRVFTWRWKVTYIDLDADGEYFSTGAIIDDNDMKRIDMDVTWRDLYGEHTLTLTTVRSL